jgi:hypothetical protein
VEGFKALHYDQSMGAAVLAMEPTPSLSMKFSDTAEVSTNIAGASHTDSLIKQEPSMPRDFAISSINTTRPQEFIWELDNTAQFKVCDSCHRRKVSSFIA